MNEELYSFCCPSCQSALHVPVALAGVTGPCPICYTEITAPMPTQHMAAQPLAAVAPVENTVVSQSYESYEQVATDWTEPSLSAWEEEAQLQQAAYAGYEDPNDGQFDGSAMNMGNFLQQRLEDRFAPEDNTLLPLPVSSTLPPEPTASAKLPKIANSEPGKQSRVMISAIVLGGLATVALATWTYLRPTGTATDSNYLTNAVADAVEPSNPEATGTDSATAPVGVWRPVSEETKREAADVTEVVAAATLPPRPDSAPTPPPTEETPASAEPAVPETTESVSPPPPGVKPVSSTISNVAPRPKIVGENEQEKQSPTEVPQETAGADPSLLTKPEVVDDADSQAETYIRQPRRTLEQFLTSKNWKERAKYTLHAEKIAPEMEEYYRENVDGPLSVQSISYLDSAPAEKTNHRITIFHVACNGCEPIPVVVEETPEGSKVDWHGFVEFKDLRLPKFFEKYNAAPGVFRVVMRRSHYFGSDVPNMDRKVCFIVEPPVPGFDTNYVWVDSDNKSLLEKIGARQEFGKQSQPTVTLRWIKDAAGSAYVMLDDIISDTWRLEELRKKGELSPGNIQHAKFSSSLKQKEGE